MGEGYFFFCAVLNQMVPVHNLLVGYRCSKLMYRLVYMRKAVEWISIKKNVNIFYYKKKKKEINLWFLITLEMIIYLKIINNAIIGLFFNFLSCQFLLLIFGLKFTLHIFSDTILHSDSEQNPQKVFFTLFKLTYTILIGPSVSLLVILYLIWFLACRFILDDKFQWTVFKSLLNASLFSPKPFNGRDIPNIFS